MGGEELIVEINRKKERVPVLSKAAVLGTHYMGVSPIALNRIYF